MCRVQCRSVATWTVVYGRALFPSFFGQQDWFLSARLDVWKLAEPHGIVFIV